jgi:hypothetical protein
MGFFGQANPNRVSKDLRAERDAFIADENAGRRWILARSAAPFNEASHFVLRLIAERTRQLLRRGGSGHLAGSIVRVPIRMRTRAERVKTLIRIEERKAGQFELMDLSDETTASSPRLAQPEGKPRIRDLHWACPPPSRPTRWSDKLSRCGALNLK